MCGISAFFLGKDANSTLADARYDHAARSIQHRGPDMTRTIIMDALIRMDFHRLRINGDIDAGMQPFQQGPWVVACNGEIYNYKTLAEQHLVSLKSGSDCEILPHLLCRLQPHHMCDMLDGVYAFVAYNRAQKRIVAARDPFGVRSLYIGACHSGFGPRLALASEVKCLTRAGCTFVAPFPPGQVLSFNMNTLEESWSRHHVGFESQFFPYFSKTDEELMAILREQMASAVRKRLMSDRLPIGCFVSGGLDSSLVSALVVREVVAKGGSPKDVWTFSIGQSGSPDLAFAERVAAHLGTTHHSVLVSEEEMISAIPSVIRDIESWDTTTVRASTGHAMLSTYIKDNTPVRVVFSGEGADEIFGSYLYFSNAPDSNAFQEESMRLCRDLHRFDVLRVEMSCATRGIECRVPFLDKILVSKILRMRPEQRGFREGMEKWLLRKAFEGTGLLPDEVLWRRKEAFSDGVTNVQSSWHTQIRRHAASVAGAGAGGENDPTSGMTCEQRWFYHVFDTHYPGMQSLIPYEWLPKWTDQKDPSARALSQYAAN